MKMLSDRHTEMIRAIAEDLTTTMTGARPAKGDETYLYTLLVMRRDPDGEMHLGRGYVPGTESKDDAEMAVTLALSVIMDLPPAVRLAVIDMVMLGERESRRERDNVPGYG